MCRIHRSSNPLEARSVSPFEDDPFGSVTSGLSECLEWVDNGRSSGVKFQTETRPGWGVPCVPHRAAKASWRPAQA